MGVRLLVEVLESAPADLTPAERLVLVVLAEEARDDARVCWPGMDKLTRRTGLKPDSLRRVFQKLAARGLEVRVEIGKDRRGRPVFAHEGTQTHYRVPDFSQQSRDEHPPSGSHRRDQRPTTEAGPASHHSPQRRDERPTEGGSASRLSIDDNTDISAGQTGQSEGPCRSGEAGRESRPSPHPHYSPHTDISAAPAQTAATTATPPKDSAEFAEFWARYPKKTDKNGARRAFRRAVRSGVDPRAIIAGAKQYAHMWAGASSEDLHWAVKSSRWLAEGMWNGSWPPRSPHATSNVIPLRRAVGGHQPFQNPTDPTAYTEEW